MVNESMLTCFLIDRQTCVIVGVFVQCETLFYEYQIRLEEYTFEMEEWKLNQILSINMQV